MSTADVFRCDYCGELAPLNAARIYFEFTEDLADDRSRWTPAVYCSDYCGSAHTSAAGSGRG
jgi:hypothetical protein